MHEPAAASPFRAARAGVSAAIAVTVATAAHAAGHWIGNHTWSHDIPLGLMPSGTGAARDEILRTEALLGDLRHPSRLFRPFAGKGRGGDLGPTLLNREAVEVLCQERMTCVVWNVIAREWQHPGDWVAPAVRDCQQTGEAVVVLHDLPNGAMALLPEFLDSLLGMGARIVQDFPESCRPVEGGAVRGTLDRMIGQAPA